MKSLSESKVAIVNQVAESICARLCRGVNCEMCQLHSLRLGLRFVFEDELPVDAAIERMSDYYYSALSHANKIHDDRYGVYANKI